MTSFVASIDEVNVSCSKNICTNILHFDLDMQNEGLKNHFMKSFSNKNKLYYYYYSIAGKKDIDLLIQFENAFNVVCLY